MARSSSSLFALFFDIDEYLLHLFIIIETNEEENKNFINWFRIILLLPYIYLWLVYGLTFDVHLLLKWRPLHFVLFECILCVFHRSLSFIYWLFIVRSFCHFILWYSYSLSYKLWALGCAVWIWREKKNGRFVWLLIGCWKKFFLWYVSSLSVGSSIDSFLTQKIDWCVWQMKFFMMSIRL